MSAPLPPNLPPCTRCRHYFVTHDARFPHGCRGLGFKSPHLPGKDVLETSGMPCHYFQPKTK